MAADLKTIYSAATADEAVLRLQEFEEKWGADYPTIVKSWRSNWERIVPFFEYPPEIRRIIYTTNAIESVNMSLRKLTKNRGSFPSDEALLKLFYMGLRNISQKWSMPIRDWKAALTRFTIEFGDRLAQSSTRVSLLSEKTFYCIDNLAPTAVANCDIDLELALFTFSQGR